MRDTNRPFYIHTVHDLTARGGATRTPAGFWVRAVASPYPSTLRQRLLAAWWIVTGKAYAIVWPRPGELEAAMNVPFAKSGEAEK